MTASLRWGLGILASLALQVGCCSIHVDYEGPHCGIKPLCLEPGCPDASCTPESGCTINGLGHVKKSLATLHGHAKHNLTCGSGCGEVYWDEYVNEPPVCDPCGCNNEWVGESVHCKPWFARLRDLWGHPYMATDCSNCGSYGPCTDCGHSSYGGQCSHCGHGIHHGRSTTAHRSSEAYVLEDESGVVISSPGTSIITGSSSDGDAVPTPAKPKSMPSVLPGDSDVRPSSPSDRESSGGKTARSKKLSTREVTLAEMEPVDRVPAKPASGRRKLTTQTR